MVLAKLKMLTLRVSFAYITVFVMTMVLMRMKHGCMGLFFMADYGIFGHEVKATERSPPDSLTRWIITRSRGFARKGIEKISRFVRVYVYLVFTSQVQARSNIFGNSLPAVNSQQVFKSTFKAMINEYYSIGIDNERYQGVLEHALSNVDFSVGTGIYMFPKSIMIIN